MLQMIYLFKIMSQNVKYPQSAALLLGIKTLSNNYTCQFKMCNIKLLSLTIPSQLPPVLPPQSYAAFKKMKDKCCRVEGRVLWLVMRLVRPAGLHSMCLNHKRDIWTTKQVITCITESDKTPP